jgi:hypothetical protein
MVLVSYPEGVNQGVSCGLGNGEQEDGPLSASPSLLWGLHPTTVQGSLVQSQLSVVILLALLVQAPTPIVDT